MKDIIETSASKTADDGEVTNGKDGLRTVLYLVLVFALTYLYEWIFVVKYLNENPGDNIASVSFRVAFAMFVPALCTLLVRLFTGEGLSGSKISFNLKDGKHKYFLLAWFSPAAFIFLGGLLYFLIFRDNFSTGMEYIIGVYKEQGVPEITAAQMRNVAIQQAVTAVILGPIINCITCFGEEWGWRGYLLFKLKDRMKPLPLMLATGVIWGLWHIPLTLMGHNYGTEYTGYPYLGVAAMVVFCFSVGTLLSYVTLKSGSCIPAVIGHGAFNSLSAIGIFFTKDGGKLLFGPSPTGLIAGIPLLVFAVILIRLMDKDEEKEK
ncbi:MAG: CPBP family intramembrane metalloprotease [Lachnospiraceae bacterium]|nr:CPBP family intramembrane metalloprotease [Lachnospiraceae bacterium]